MTSLRSLVVDDESLARRRLVRLLERSEQVGRVDECSSGSEAVQAIRTCPPDLLFLDIQMPGLDGVSVLEAVGVDAVGAVIFVTAYDRYAIRAFDLHAVDYLLKPFTDSRFERALERAVGRLRRTAAETLSSSILSAVSDYRTLSRSPTPAGAAPPTERPSAESPPRDRLTVRSAGKVRFIAIPEIDWLEAAGSYVRLHLGAESCLLRESVTRLARRLPQDTFVRIHRSTIVNVTRVVELRSQSHREMIVVLHDGTELKLSRTYRDAAGPRLGLT